MKKSKLSKKYKLLSIVAPTVIVLDQITKKIIVDRFALHDMLPVIPNFFDITRIHNTGAAFGMMQSADPSIRVPFFMIVPVVALTVITMLFRSLPKNNTWTALALSFILGGAIGNLIDRLVYGYVVDFLYFSWKHEYFFPAFNVADSAITVGAVLLLLDMKGAQSNVSTAS